MINIRILIIEDEFNLADAISTKLKKEKYIVDICTDGLEGNYNALSNIYDLIILDVMLPNIILFHIKFPFFKKYIDFTEESINN